MQKYLEKTGEIKFEKIFNQKLGFLLLKDFAENVTENACPQIKFYEAPSGFSYGNPHKSWDTPVKNLAIT
ncbi:hypothetical protein ANCCAN_17940 [Ancylostoma caninum]|uniref:RGS domain-containing protein n=1 Tax=Ancylostoma caninum TaxID=29170 RepID=A0A368FVE5_ANCCA|nr:hypothetical protein ANCCAN_17940 [Ancylostoma caninum]